MIVVALGSIGLAACGSDDGGGGSASTAGTEVEASTTVASTTTAAPAATAATTTVVVTTAPATTAAPTTTGAPVDFGTAVTERLGDELGDPTLAAAVVTGLGPDGLSGLEQAMQGRDPATDILLAYRPPTVADEAVDSIIAYAFGNRVAADGTTTPGPVNEQLADVIAGFVAEHPVPVFAQEEIASFLIADGVPNVFSIGPDIAEDGTVVYLSTVGVAEKAVAMAAAEGIELGHVGVVGFADHSVRCVLTTRSIGLTADVPAGIALPSTYDPESGQVWTRDRQTYVTTDLIARTATLA